MLEMIGLLFYFITPWSLLVSGLILVAAYFTCRQPFAMVKLIFRSLFWAVGSVVIVYGIARSNILPSRDAWGLACLSVVPFAYAYSIGSNAPAEVGYWQQIACVLCLPPFFLGIPLLLAPGGDAGLGAGLAMFFFLPGLLALIPGWMLGAFLNTKNLESPQDEASVK